MRGSGIAVTAAVAVATVGGTGTVAELDDEDDETLLFLLLRRG